MTKRMLIDATHPEETRVAVVSGNNKLDEYDYETLVRKQLKSNIYLVKVTRVEPSLQAAFVDFGGNRHGFLPFPEIHPDYYRIPIADREALLAEERALAAEQAAREDAEDEAELAASGGVPATAEDADVASAPEDEKDGEDSYVPRHTGSIAADVARDAVADTDEDESVTDAEEEEEEEEEETAEAEEPALVAAAEEEEAADEAEAQPEPAVDMVGGDSVDPPVFRSSIKRRYKIQEVIKRNQIMLIQINKEERGNKGAAVTSYISLPGRYCVLMPNSPRGGGVSRKVSNAKDRQRLKVILKELNVPEGMSVILRTAGVARGTAEIKRDLDYLLRLWDEIRELTLKSTAPALIYEEGNLIKRAIRDLYSRDIDEVLVAGEAAHKSAHEFMRMLMPSHADKVIQYTDATVPLFFRYQVETQIDAIHNPTMHLKSGGYIVINPTEALVSIDVNSGKATKGRHIEETALKTNLEAADEIARQLRLRDLGGLVVIDFIDMEDRRGNRIVEKRMRDAMQTDRARIQLGRISAFGLMELSRQRLHPSLVETNFETCPHCKGLGLVRTVETSAVMLLRAIEEEGLKGRASEIKVSVPSDIGLYVFNHKREMLAGIEKRHNIRVFINADDTLLKPNFTIEVLRTTGVQKDARPWKPAPVQGVDISDMPEYTDDGEGAIGGGFAEITEVGEPGLDRPRGRDRGGRGDRGGRDRGGRNRGGRDRGDRGGDRHAHGGNRHDRGHDRHEGGGRPPRDFGAPQPDANAAPAADGAPPAPREHGGEGPQGEGRRRGRRGGRNRGGRNRGGERGDRPNGGNRAPQGADAVPGAGEQPREIRSEAPQSRPSEPRHEPRPQPAQNDGAYTQHQADSGASSQQQAAASGEGGSRKGWWKRLTE